MNTDSEPIEIIKRWRKSFQSDFSAFQKNITLKFQKSIKELDQSYEAKYKNIINNKQQKIEQLETKFNKFLQIHALMGENLESRTNSRTDEENKQVNRQEMQNERQNERPLFNLDRNMNRIQQENQIMRSQSERQNQRLNQTNVNKDLARENHQIKRNGYQEQREISQSIQMENSQSQVEASSQEHKSSQHKRNNLPLLKSKYNNYLGKVSLTPNFTRIKFVEYAPYSECFVFSDFNIQYLKEHNFSQVESIKLQRQQMTNETLNKIILLFRQNNIISLQIDENKLTSLNSIKKLNLRKLVHLDVSKNQINISDAQLLASSEFNELIYLTISFKREINQNCWQILLKNRMRNFPKLQAIDICNLNQIVDAKLCQKIKDCLKQLAAEQRKRMITLQGGQTVSYYPPDYEIKIKWQQKQTDDKLSDQQAQLLNLKWRNQVDYVNDEIKSKKRQRGTRKRRGKGRGKGRGSRGGMGRSIKREKDQHQNQLPQASARKEKSHNKIRRKIIRKENREKK